MAREGQQPPLYQQRLKREATGFRPTQTATHFELGEVLDSSLYGQTDPVLSPLLMGIMTTNEQLFPRYRMTAKQREIAKELDRQRMEAYIKLTTTAYPTNLFTEMFGDA